jgi:hypothetical protein
MYIYVCTYVCGCTYIIYIYIYIYIFRIFSSRPFLFHDELSNGNRMNRYAYLYIDVCTYVYEYKYVMN